MTTTSTAKPPPPAPIGPSAPKRQSRAADRRRPRRRPADDHDLAAARSGDQGSITSWAAIVVVAVFVVAALVVDSGVMINAYQRAASIAREAARVAGQHVDPDQKNGAARLDPASARIAGQAYLDASGCAGGTIAINGDTITATCPYPYTVVFLPGHYQADGTGSATPLWVD